MVVSARRYELACGGPADLPELALSLNVATRKRDDAQTPSINIGQDQAHIYIFFWFSDCDFILDDLAFRRYCSLAHVRCDGKPPFSDSEPLD